MSLKSKEFTALLPTLSLLAVLTGGFSLLFFHSPKLYFAVLSSEEFWQSFSYALWVGFLVVFFATFLFLLLYYLLFLLKFEYKQELGGWLFFLQLPLFIPYAFCAMLFFILFFPQGIFAEFLPFLLGSTQAVVIAYVYKVTPFLLLVSLPTLLGLKKEEIYFHKLYSQSAFLFFHKILLRRNLKVYFLAIFVIFAYVFNAYEIPSILGSSFEKMPALLVYEQLHEMQSLSLQKAYVMSLVYFLALSPFGLIFFALYKLTRGIL